MIGIEIFLLVAGIVGFIGMVLFVIKIVPFIRKKKRELAEKRAERLKKEREARINSIVGITNVGLIRQQCAKCGRGFNSWYSCEGGHRTCPNCENVNYMLGGEIIVATNGYAKPTFREAMEWKKNKGLRRI